MPALTAYHAYRLGAAVARALPRPVAGAVGSAAAPLMGRGGRRDMVERHLRRLHGPGLTGARLDREARCTFRSYARYWVESFRLDDLSPPAVQAGMTAEGLEHLDAALARGKGAILALPHLGGWDFGGAWLAGRGYPVTVVVEAVEPPELFRWFVERRRRVGLSVVPLGPQVGTTVLGALRRNEVVVLVSDRDLTGDGVEVTFFGEVTTLPGGPATLALRTGAAVLPTAVYFAGRRRHRGVIRPPVPAARHGRFRDDVRDITQRLAHAFEDLIRAAPAQWHLLQPNWPSDRAAPG